MEIRSTRLILSTPGPSQAREFLSYYRRNRLFLREWEPARNDEFYTLSAQRGILRDLRRDMRAGKSISFGLRHQGLLIGSITFSAIIRGNFQSCYLGYKLDGDYAGKGLMTEALQAAIHQVFSAEGLHRIEANIIPRNRASRRVAEKLGFENEGLSRRYLRIGGVWEDHIRYALLNPREE